MGVCICKTITIIYYVNEVCKDIYIVKFVHVLYIMYICGMCIVYVISVVMVG